MDQPSTRPTPPPRFPRETFLALFLCGQLFTFVGGVLPVWGHHLRFEYLDVGGYFLSIAAGLSISVAVARQVLRRIPLGRALAINAAIACAAILLLALVPPPAGYIWRLIGVAAVGFSAGAIITALTRLIQPLFEQNPAATINLSAIAFGAGCLVPSLMVAIAYPTYTATGILFWLAMIPAFSAVHYARTGMDAPEREIPSQREEIVAHLKHPPAILFSLLLLFQSGNEWSIAGWLPVFLVQRMGVSPSAALYSLSFYWLVLMLGRFLAQAALRHFSHRRMLFGGAFLALAGLFLLTFAANLAGGVVALACIALGYALIYPLLAEWIGGRFPKFAPGFYSGLFSLATLGGFLAPASLGPLCQAFGIRAVTVASLICSILVFLLLVLIWIESILTRRRPAR